MLWPLFVAVFADAAAAVLPWLCTVQESLGLRTTGGESGNAELLSDVIINCMCAMSLQVLLSVFNFCGGASVMDCFAQPGPTSTDSKLLA